MVSDVTETAVPDVLLISIAPAVVSAEIKKAARLIAPVLPMPAVALRSTVFAVIRLVPSTSPPLAVSVTILPVAVIGFERMICCPEVSVTFPAAMIAFGTAMPYTFATMMSPAGEVIEKKPEGISVLAAMPVWADSVAPSPVISPVPLIDPADVIETFPSPAWALIGALTAMVPLPVVVIEIVEVVPALLTPELAIVIPLPAFVRLITPQPVPAVEPTDETLLNVTGPPPD